MDNGGSDPPRQYNLGKISNSAASAPAPYHQSSASKKRRTSNAASGSRGVANLTPEQLAKKRANDRDAQRAIRERTKGQIESLEKKIRELTSQQPYQELQNAVRQKELAEAENEEIKKRLASAISLLQPLLGRSTLIDPNSSYHPVDRPSPIVTSGIKVSQVSSPLTSNGPHSATSATSPFATTSPSLRQIPSSVSQSSYTSQPNTFSSVNVLGQRQGNVSHGLPPLRAEEKLGVGYVLQNRQDTRDGRESYSNASTPAASSCPPLPMHTLSPISAVRDGFGASNLACSAPVRNISPTCLLDGVLLDFLAERRQQAEKGVPNEELVGPAYPSLVSLLHPERSQFSHALSKVFTDMLVSFPDISTLPEQVAILYIMFLIMRWQISPNQENYERLPDWVTPRPSQLITPHPAWIDHLPWPRMRDRLVQIYPKIPFDDFFIPYTTTVSLNWPYEARDTLLTMHGTDELSINPVFERHLMELSNWSLGPAFVKAHPSLAGTCRIKPDPERKQKL